MWKNKPTNETETKPFNGLLHSFDLPTLIEKMKHSPSWARGDLNAMILLNSPERQIILAALHRGTEINSFQSADSVTVQVVEGALTVHVRQDSAILDKSHLITLYEKIKYSLTTNEDTVILLTIAKDSFQQAQAQN